MDAIVTVARRSEPASGARRAPRLARGALVVFLVGATIALAFHLPLRDALAGFLGWVGSLGAWGPVILGAAYVPATVLFVPGSILTLGAGFLFGVVRGTIAVSLGSTVGSTVTFLLGRTLARGWVEARVAKDPRFRAIDRAVVEQGWKIVLLVRLSPVFPYNLLGYAFGATRVRLRDYVLASWVGMLPGTILYVYLGSAVRSLGEVLSGHVEGGVAQKALFAVGLLATVAVTVLVTRIARAAIRGAAPGVEKEIEP